MMRRLLLVLLLAFGAAFPVPALAQVDDLELTEDEIRNVRRVGDKPVFCSNAGTILSEYERDVAAAIASALFLDHEFFAFETFPASPPLDFRLPLDLTRIYLLLAQRCDALMGFTLLADYRDWMRPSLPYLGTQTVLAVREDSPYRAMTDIPFGERIGTRMAALGDNVFAGFLSSQPEGQRWRRTNYPDHQLLLDRLVEGKVEAAIVWQPALARYLVEHPEVRLRRIEELVFPIQQSDFVLALRAREQFFAQQVNEAIRALTADGTLQRLAEKHGLPAVLPDLQ